MLLSLVSDCFGESGFCHRNCIKHRFSEGGRLGDATLWDLLYGDDIDNERGDPVVAILEASDDASKCDAHSSKSVPTPSL